MKPKNRKEFVKILNKNGFIKLSSGKHEKWSNGDRTISVPKQHKEFHVIGHWEILKKAGIVS